MSAPNAEKPPAAELEDWIRKVADDLPRDEFIVPKERARDFQLLYGLCQQAARFASSYVLLSNQGFQREAAALARCSFEHAVTAHWSYFTEGGVERLAIDVNRDFKGYYMTMSEYLDDEEFRKQAESHEAPDGKGLPPVSHMMWDLDSGGFLRTSYRNLSLSVHPTHLTVSTYLEETESGTQLRHEPRGGAEYATLYTTAVAAMLAYSLVEYISDPLAAKVLVEGPSNKLRLPPFLHDSLPDKKRRVFATADQK
mgnify:CR=1 FL=1